MTSNNSSKRQSPMVNVISGETLVEYGKKITITEEAFVSQYIIRVDPANASLVAEINNILGGTLPTKMNTVGVNSEVLIAKYSTDEFIVIDKRDSAEDTIAKLASAFVGKHAMVSDVTGGQTMLHLHGHRVRDVLAKGLMLDTHPSVFIQGQCASTILAQSPVLIVPVKNTIDDGNHYILAIRRSFSDHLGAWLKDACLEYSA